MSKLGQDIDLATFKEVPIILVLLLSVVAPFSHVLLLVVMYYALDPQIP